MTIKLVIIDSTVIANSAPGQLEGLEDVCGRLASKGVTFALVSTNNQGMRQAVARSAKISFTASSASRRV